MVYVLFGRAAAVSAPSWRPSWVALMSLLAPMNSDDSLKASP